MGAGARRVPLVVALLDQGPAWDTLVRRPTIWLEIRLPGGVMHRAVLDHKRAARASHAQARCGHTPRGGTSSQEAQPEATGNVSRARVSVPVASDVGLIRVSPKCCKVRSCARSAYS